MSGWHCAFSESSHSSCGGPSQPPVPALPKFAHALVKLELELSELLLARSCALHELRTRQACNPLLDCPHITGRAGDAGRIGRNGRGGRRGRSGSRGCGGRSCGGCGCGGRRRCCLSRLQLHLHLSCLSCVQLCLQLRQLLLGSCQGSIAGGGRRCGCGRSVCARGCARGGCAGIRRRLLLLLRLRMRATQHVGRPAPPRRSIEPICDGLLFGRPHIDT